MNFLSEQTATSSLEREWRNQNKVFTIKALFGKRRKSFLWPVDLSAVTLDNMKRSILNTFPSLQNTKPEDLTLHFCKAGEKKCEELGLEEDDTFRQYLKTCAMQASLFLKVQINTIQKPFSDWSLRKVCDLLRLPLAFQDFQKFECGVDPLNDPLAKELLVHLRTDLKYRQRTISINVNEASCSEYVSLFLVAAATLFGGRVKLCPGFYIEGKYGRGPLDFCLRFLETIIGVVEVKNQLFNQGMAQILMQTHTSLETNQKRKNSEIEGQFADKVYGIVTDGTTWRFVECTIDGDKPTFKIHSSTTPFIIDWNEESGSGIAMVFGRIIWLLKEAEKWDRLDITEKRRRVR